MKNFRPGRLFPTFLAATLLAIASMSLNAAAGSKKNIRYDKPINQIGDIEQSADSEVAECRDELGQARRELGTTRAILERTRQAHARELEAMADRLDEIGTENKELEAELKEMGANCMSLQDRADQLVNRESVLNEQLKVAKEAADGCTVELKEARIKIAVLADNLGAIRASLAAERDRYRDEGLIRAGKALREQVRDPDNTALVWSLNDVGLLYLAEGRLDDAEALFQRALLILSRNLPDEKSAAGTLLQHLADTAWRKNDLIAAASFHEQAVDAFAASVGKSHSRYAAALNGQAGVLHALGEAKKAEEIYREALSIYEAQRPIQPVEVATPAHNLGLLYLDQGRLAEAGPMLEKAISALGNRPQQHANRALIMTRSMIRYCQQAGDMEMATLYQAKANELMLSAMTP